MRSRQRRPLGEDAAPARVAAAGDQASHEKRAWATALRALARRPRSAIEIERLLLVKFEDAALVARTLDRLAEARLLDDAAVADAVLRDAARRGLGSRRVGRVLARRGVAPAAEFGHEVAVHDREAAAALLARRFPDGPPRDPRGRARALRLLAARGFPGGLARRLLGVDRAVDDDVDLDRSGED